MEQHKKWSEFLPFVQFAFNSTVHKSTNFTPNELHFWRNLFNSGDLLVAKPHGEQAMAYGMFVKDLEEKLRSSFAIARECLKASAESSKRQYHERIGSPC